MRSMEKNQAFVYTKRRLEQEQNLPVGAYEAGLEIQASRIGRFVLRLHFIHIDMLLLWPKGERIDGSWRERDYFNLYAEVFEWFFA